MASQVREEDGAPRDAGLGQIIALLVDKHAGVGWFADVSPAHLAFVDDDQEVGFFRPIRGIEAILS